MNVSDHEARDSDSYRVFLLRLWREKDGPWHASLQAAGAAAPQRFANLDALAQFLTAAVFTSIVERTSEAGETD